MQPLADPTRNPPTANLHPTHLGVLGGREDVVKPLLQHLALRQRPVGVLLRGAGRVRGWGGTAARHAHACKPAEHAGARPLAARRRRRRRRRLPLAAKQRPAWREKIARSPRHRAPQPSFLAGPLAPDRSRVQHQGPPTWCTKMTFSSTALLTPISCGTTLRAAWAGSGGAAGAGAWLARLQAERSQRQGAAGAGAARRSGRSPTDPPAHPPACPPSSPPSPTPAHLSMSAQR